MEENPDKTPNIPANWISRRVSSPEAVARNVGPLEIFSLMLPGDELRRFETPPGSWKMRCGRAGYVILREGKVIAATVLSMN